MPGCAASEQQLVGSVAASVRDSYLMVNQERNQLGYRTCHLSNLKTPTSRKDKDDNDYELVSQTMRMWKLTSVVRKIMYTPLKKQDGSAVVQYVLEDTDGTQWLVYSKNKEEGNTSYVPMQRSKGLHFHAGEVVCETAWQQIEKDERPLLAIRTNQVGVKGRL